MPYPFAPFATDATLWRAATVWTRGLDCWIRRDDVVPFGITVKPGQSYREAVAVAVAMLDETTWTYRGVDPDMVRLTIMGL